MKTDLHSDLPIIVMSRMFDAPRDLVWSVLTDPRHVAHWYGGHGFANPVCEMDVRPGGRWRHVMRTPSGAEYAMEYVFVEVARPEKLVWQDVDYGKRAGGGPPARMMTVTLEDAGPRTKWTLVTRFQSIAERDATARHGFAETLAEGCEKVDDIARVLARTPPVLAGMVPGTFVPMLRTLSELLDKGAAHASATGGDPAALLGARLAPDMFTLAQQVQMACYYALDTTARVTGAEPPRPGDAADATLDAAKARIAATIARIEQAGAAPFAGADERDIVLPLQGELVLAMKGLRFFRDWGAPHFYFHVVTAYDILRSSGVPLGKRDYITRIGDAVRSTSSTA